MHDMVKQCRGSANPFAELEAANGIDILLFQRMIGEGRHWRHMVLQLATLQMLHVSSICTVRVVENESILAIYELMPRLFQHMVTCRKSPK